MEIEVFTLCDAAADYNGRLSILGIFDSIFAPSLPATHPTLSIALRLRFAKTEVGQHTIVLHIVDQDGNQIAPEVTGQFEFQIRNDDAIGKVNLIMNMQGLLVTKYGEHAVNLSIDRHEIDSLLFWVRQP